MRHAESLDRCTRSLGNLGNERVIHAVKHQRELLAAIARGEVERTARKAVESDRHRAQCLIACLVSIAIVERFEAIDVEQQQRKRRALAHRLVPQLLDALIEHAPVVDSGEAIARRHVAQHPGFEIADAVGSFQVIADDRAHHIGERQQHDAVGGFPCRHIRDEIVPTYTASTMRFEINAA